MQRADRDDVELAAQQLLGIHQQTPEVEPRNRLLIVDEEIHVAAAISVAAGHRTEYGDRAQATSGGERFQCHAVLFDQGIHRAAPVGYVNSLTNSVPMQSMARGLLD